MLWRLLMSFPNISHQYLLVFGIFWWLQICSVWHSHYLYKLIKKMLLNSSCIYLAQENKESQFTLFKWFCLCSTLVSFHTPETCDVCVCVLEQYPTEEDMIEWAKRESEREEKERLARLTQQEQEDLELAIALSKSELSWEPGSALHGPAQNSPKQSGDCEGPELAPADPTKRLFSWAEPTSFILHRLFFTLRLGSLWQDWWFLEDQDRAHAQRPRMLEEIQSI